MDGTFVNELADKLRTAQILSVDGQNRLLIPEGWSLADNHKPEAKALKVGTLTGLVDYLKSADLLGSPLVHVESPTLVKIIGLLEDEGTLFRRQCYLQASTDLVGGPAIAWSTFMDAETFTIGLQSGFEKNAGRDDLLLFIASIKENTVRETSDSGYAQTVTRSAGVVLKQETPVPGSFILKPFRTFREIDQPASTFILRLRSNAGGEKPAVALFEGEGNKWKLKAMEDIKAWLTAQLPDVTILA